MGNEYWIADLGKRDALDVSKRGKYMSFEGNVFDSWDDVTLVGRGQDDPIMKFAGEWVEQGQGPFALLIDVSYADLEFLTEYAFTEYDAFDAVNGRPFEGRKIEPIGYAFYMDCRYPLRKYISMEPRNSDE